MLTSSQFTQALVVTALLAVPMVWAAQQIELERQFAQLRVAGEPTSGEELNAYYRIPPGEMDITQVWVPLLERVEERAQQEDLSSLPIVTEPDLFRPSHPNAGENLAAARQLAVAWSVEIAQLLEAAEQPGSVRWPFDFSLGDDTQLFQIQALRTGAMLVRLKCLVAASEGNVGEITRSLHALFRLSELASCPSLIADLVGIAILGVASDVLMRCLPFHDFSDDQLHDLQQGMEAFHARETLRQMLISERAIVLEETRKLGLGPFAAGNQLRVNMWFHQAIKSPDLDWKSAIAEWKRLNDDIADSPTGYRTFTDYSMVRHRPNMSRIGLATVRREIRDRALMLLLAARRQQRDEGQWPTQLADIKQQYLPATWRMDVDARDPFRDSPLSYHLDEQALVIYSVGPDGIDNVGDVVAFPGREMQDEGYRLSLRP